MTAKETETTIEQLKDAYLLKERLTLSALLKTAPETTVINFYEWLNQITLTHPQPSLPDIRSQYEQDASLTEALLAQASTEVQSAFNQWLTLQ